MSIRERTGSSRAEMEAHERVRGADAYVAVFEEPSDLTA